MAIAVKNGSNTYTFKDAVDASVRNDGLLIVSGDNQVELGVFSAGNWDAAIDTSAARATRSGAVTAL